MGSETQRERMRQQIEQELRPPRAVRWLLSVMLVVLFMLPLYLIAFGVCMMVFDHEAGLLGIVPVGMGVWFGARLLMGVDRG